MFYITDWPFGMAVISIFIEGCEPFAEDTWDTLKIGKYTFHGVKLCPRCKVTKHRLRNQFGLEIYCNIEFV